MQRTITLGPYVSFINLDHNLMKSRTSDKTADIFFSCAKNYKPSANIRHAAGEGSNELRMILLRGTHVTFWGFTTGQPST